MKIYKFAFIALTFWSFGVLADEANFFAYSDGLASVYISNVGWGYIDKSGKFAFPPGFFIAYQFSEGVAYVEKKGKPYFIDHSGKVVLDVSKFGDGADSFSDGLAGFYKKGKWGLIDHAGNIVVPPKFDNTYSCSEGLCKFGSQQGEHFYMGFTNHKGEIVIPTSNYRYVGNFSEGLAMYIVDGGDNCGYLDKSGTKVLTFNDDVECLTDFKDGAAAVSLKSIHKDGFIDHQGNWLIKPVLKDAGFGFDKGVALVKTADDSWKLIDKHGNYVSKDTYEGSYPEFGDGLAAVKMNNEWGYIDHTGKWVIRPEQLSKTLKPYIKISQSELENGIDERAKEQKTLALFRKSLKEGDETNCGPVIEVKAKLVKISFPVENYGDEHWIRRDAILPAGYGCRFVNGLYQPPE